MKNRKLLIFIAAILSVIVLFAACAKKEDSSVPASEGYYNGYYYDSSDSKEKAPAEESVPEPGSVPGNTEHQQIVVEDPAGRKLIYTVSMTINTENYDADYSLILSKLREYGGYTYAETSSGTKPVKDTDYGREAEFVLKIPVEKLDAYLTSLEQNTEISRKEINVEDTTEHYFDTEHRIELLEERYKRLEGYLEKVETIEDVIALESEMNDIIYQLDNLRGEVKGLDNLIAYSTVRISLYEKVNIAKIPHENPNIFERMGNAVTVSFRAVVDLLSGLLVVIAASLPVLGLLAVIALIVFIIVKICINASRKKKQKRAAMMNAANGGMTQHMNG